MNTGKLVTIFILAIAALMAGGAWWNNWNKGHRALDYWGSENAYQIRLAKKVMLYRLANSADEHAQLEIGGNEFAPIQSDRDISEARGLVHARQALIQDFSYNWQSASMADPIWQYAVRFGEGDSAALVLFNLDQGIISRGGAAPPLSTNLGPGLKTVFEEQLRN